VRCDPFSPSPSSPYDSVSRTSLDSIGSGGFSHNFGSLKGNAIMIAFESFSSIKPSLSIVLSFIFGVLFPNLSLRMPNNRRKGIKSIMRSTRGIATELLDKATKEKADISTCEVDKSILTALGEIFRFFQIMVRSG